MCVCVCVCVKARQCIASVQRLVAAPASALKSACSGTRVLPTSRATHYRGECACVSTPEVTRRNYPLRPVLQQTATGAVISSNNTQPIILGLKTTLYVVLIGAE